MTLEFEKLTDSVEDMARQANQRRQNEETLLKSALGLLHEYATAWDTIRQCLETAVSQADEKFYRAARPLARLHPIDQPITPPPCPPQAILIATDGSQIIPDRHAAYQYYLINVGGMVYYHGYGRSPDIFTVPVLRYPRGDDVEEDDPFEINGGLVSIRRDKAEIETMAEKVWDNRFAEAPVLAIMDQRLLYWPTSGGGEGQKVVEAWQDAMTKIRDSGGWLAGYIDRSGKRSVLGMLNTLEKMHQPQFNPKTLHRLEPYQDLNDTRLFGRILQARGERSAVFVDVSQHNRAFAERDALNEICFFYLRTGTAEDQIARVDIPLWVALEEDVVSAVHALVYDQCQILGNYPYIITRADEVAVVTHREQEELDFRIGLQMETYGVEGHITAKQQSKDLARSNKTRFEGL